MKVYLGGPITGLTYDDCTSWRDEVQPALEAEGIEVRNPMRDKEHFVIGNGPLPSRFDAESDAVQQDLNDIDEVDVILVNLIGATHVSIGSMCELGYAKARGKYIIVAYEEGSIHDHLFVELLATDVVASLEDALDRLHEVIVANA